VDNGRVQRQRVSSTRDRLRELEARAQSIDLNHVRAQAYVAVVREPIIADPDCDQYPRTTWTLNVILKANITRMQGIDMKLIKVLRFSLWVAGCANPLSTNFGISASGKLRHLFKRQSEISIRQLGLPDRYRRIACLAQFD
jgi:hypothetical protein